MAVKYRFTGKFNKDMCSTSDRIGKLFDTKIEWTNPFTLKKEFMKVIDIVELSFLKKAIDSEIWFNENKPTIISILNRRKDLIQQAA